MIDLLNPEIICKDLVTLVKDTAKFIRTEATIFDKSKIEYKGRSNDLVSYVDKETEKRLVAGLRTIVPTAGFIGEEGTVEQGKGNLQWVIDPLDGTTNFAHGLPVYSISVALLQGDDVLVGVVHEINRDECFYAWLGGGAYCNGKKISISSIETMDKALIATGFPYSLKGKADQYFDVIKDLVNHSHGLRRLGSAAVDLAYVASGRFEAYFEFNLKIWDIAAGILLVKEAGGMISDFSGGNNYLHGNEILAAGHVHKEVLQTVKKYW